MKSTATTLLFASAIALAVPSMAQNGGTGGDTAGTIGGQGGDTYGGQSGTTGTGSMTGTTDSNSGTTRSNRMRSSGPADLQQFVEKAAMANLAEIRLGQLAQQKADDPEVKQFAQTMIDQHTAAQEQLEQIARTSGITVPSGLDSKHEKIQSKLEKLDGSEFDREYMKVMVEDHKQTANLLRDQRWASDYSGSARQPNAPVGTGGTASPNGVVGTSGETSAIESYAATTLPQVEQHLNMAKDLESHIGKEAKDQDREKQ
jgi:predicted outer membrane protein